MDNAGNIFDTLEEAIEDLKQGKMVIVADDEARENEGDLICAAEKVTPEIVNFMISEAKGLICLSMEQKQIEQIGLSEMVAHNTDAKGTAFTQSIDADPKYGVSTGISAFDRAKTIQVAIANDAKPNDLRRPGHIFPLIAKQGGVLERTGHTEAVVDLMKMADMKPAGVICEIINSDGSMARRDDLQKFAKKHNLKFITVAQVIAHRLKNERFVKRAISVNLPTEFGEFEIYGYVNTLNGQEHVALVKDDGSDKIPLVRMHSECLTGDIFHSLKCDCNSQLHEALKMIDKHGKGALVYLKEHEGRGIGLINKLKAYALQDQGQDTIEANISLGFQSDLRDYGVGAQILLDIGYAAFNLITNNPTKIVALEGYGLKINERVQTNTVLNCHNKKYICTKKEKMDHLMNIISVGESLNG